MTIKNGCHWLLHFLCSYRLLFLRQGRGDDPTFTIDQPTAEQIQAAKWKEKLVLDYKNRKLNPSLMGLGEMKTLDVTVFEQETNYWVALLPKNKSCITSMVHQNRNHIMLTN